MVNSVTHSQADGMDASCGREKRTSYPCLIEASKWNGLAPDNRRVKNARSLCPRVEGLFWRCPTVKKTLSHKLAAQDREDGMSPAYSSARVAHVREENWRYRHIAPPHFCVESLETIVWYWRLMRFASVCVAVWHGHFAWNKKVSSK